MNNSKNVKINKIINIENHFSKEEFDILLKIAKETFKKKENIGWVDTVIYNLLRGKPLFDGIEKLKDDKYYGFEYINKKPFYLRIPRYQQLLLRFGHNQSHIYQILKNDKEHKIVSLSTKTHLTTIITLGFNEAFGIKNGEIV